MYYLKRGFLELCSESASSENVYWFSKRSLCPGNSRSYRWSAMGNRLLTRWLYPKNHWQSRNLLLRKSAFPVRLSDRYTFSFRSRLGKLFFSPERQLSLIQKCAELLREKGIPALEANKKAESGVSTIQKIIFPHLTFFTW